MNYWNGLPTQHPRINNTETITNMSHTTNPPTFRHFPSEGIGVIKTTCLSKVKSAFT